VVTWAHDVFGNAVATATFATTTDMGRMRPNRIGLSTCRVAKVEGISIEVEGLDAVDGTPVLDIKPVWKGNEPRGEIREPRWAQEIMSKYW
jgi:tRNA (Thr-GGU) A37 N-methylase